jgi:putative molybdopterin biosynthesis protein
VKLESRVRRFRVERGLKQQELAQLCGLSRQALSQLENGSSVPSTAAALQLARALGCRVEELFALQDASAVLVAQLARPLSLHASDASPRLLLGRVSGRWVAHRLDPRQRPQDLSVASDGVLVSLSGSRARVRPLLPEHRLEENLLLAGCDPALGLVAARAERLSPGGRNLWLEATSGRSLSALGRGEVHAAGAHLFDPETGVHNLPFMRKALAGQAMVVVTVAQLEVGLAVAKGNPRRLRTAADLAKKGARIVNRDESAGARRLLDRLLQAAGLDGRSLAGNDQIAAGHLDAARAVALGQADAAMVTCAAALALGLDFVQLASDRFDLALPKASLADRRVVRLLETLASKELRRELSSLGGYDTRRSGTIAAELE